MNYISVKEASQNWNIKERRVRALCQEGKVPGAKRTGRSWLIPANASKPVDGRTKLSRNAATQDRIHLMVAVPPNNREELLAMPQEERELREITDIWLQGRQEETLAKASSFVSKHEDDGYLLIANYILLSLHVTSGMKVAIMKDRARIKRILKANDFRHSRAYADLITKKPLTEIDLCDIPENAAPVIGYAMILQTVSAALASNSPIDISWAELACSFIDARDYPICALYGHIGLAMYYSLTATHKTLYSHHIEQALAIALPNKWYLPLAQYAYSLGWEEIRTVDPAAFKEITALSDTVIASYIELGLLNKALPRFKNVKPQEVRVAFLMASGKTNVEIAETMNISLYQVKTIATHVYEATGTSNRKELKDMVLSNFASVI